MGVLDDAIRDHLELRRRHGASEEDLADQEAEALGPARRSPSAPGEPDQDDAGEAQADTAAAEDEVQDDGAHADHPAREEEAAVDLPHPAQEPAHPAAGAGPDEEREGAGESGGGDLSPVQETGVAEHHDHPYDHGLMTDPLDLPETEVAEVPRGPETADRSAGRAEEDRGAKGGEDPALRDESAGRDDGKGEEENVLEDTPEFLQETPEHDRLWFEQKRPRDFDFDD